MVEKEKITYVDFKTISQQKEKKPSVIAPFHTNPVIDRLFKFVHTKLALGKEDYKSFTEFKPDDLL
ncbi:MAG TPA: hypothetical protein P5556_00010 [Candidatus Gastranaerophilales bacterium]|nr:hypothetical protein [Candidatus Gastranaerophilales bacterium]